MDELFDDQPDEQPVVRTTYTDIVTSDQWLCAECGYPRAGHEELALESTHGAHDFKRRHYPFVAMLRIHNEQRWIGEVLSSITPLCSKIFILDDHSTDETVPTCLAFGDIVRLFESPFTGLNESRDKNWLYDQVITYCAPDWILCIDGDEVLEPNGPDIIRKACSHPGSDPHAYALKIEFLWNDPHTVRTDRIYGDFWRPSLFRPYHENPNVPDSRTLLREFRFMATPFGRVLNTGDKPNLHCSSVPQRLLHGFRRCPARLKHYGYMMREWRVGKLDYYTSIDWKNEAEDHYAHMTQADQPRLEELPRVQDLVNRGILSPADLDRILSTPADKRLLHAGPLELKPWEPDKPWEMSAWAKRQ